MTVELAMDICWWAGIGFGIFCICLPFAYIGMALKRSMDAIKTSAQKL
jgi:hypothetical protein